ncbi:LolA family protein [Roseomonas elaeocarpi]|uniref:Outer membrane lipoprotein carrier protein LolA n=1 Tax=Roseomonas elaeocarpi TaxID=907779 RepID=A0ABV6JWG9_9PROT
MSVMLRRSLLLSAPLLALAPRWSFAQSAARGGLTQADLRRIEDYFNSLTTLKARFLQIGQSGSSAQGTAWIWRPGRMRFEYDAADGLLLVASHSQFMQFDRELGQPSVVPTSATPLSFLLQPQLKLSGDVTVVGGERSGGFLRVTVQRTSSPSEGQLTLVLAESPMELRQWVVLDPQRRETRVSLSQIEVGGRFDPLLFEFNDPRFMENEARRRQ